MSYTGKKYKSRREKKKTYERNGRIFLIAGLLIVLILAIVNRVYIYDSFRFYFN